MQLRYHTRSLIAATSGFIALCGTLFVPNAAKPHLNSALGIAPAEAAAPDLGKAVLGQALFFDTRLSQPTGMSCATCHSPDAGFTSPNAEVNRKLGPVAGIVPGRFGFRKPPTVAYAAFIPVGPPHYDPAVSAFVGGQFWDGRAPDLAAQATMPFQNPNEMNNFLHGVGNPNQVVSQVAKGPYARLFQAVYGPHIFEQPAQAFQDIAEAIAAYEKSPVVSPFDSKYDYWRKGQAQLSPDELDGLRLVTGSWSGRPGGTPYYKIIGGQKVLRNAQCVLCHGIPADPKTGPDLWTNTCYANIGVPKNAANPYYTETDAKSNPYGYNSLGKDFIDIGLGDFLYPQMGLPSGNAGPGSDGNGDFLQINGTFKAPTLRNVAQVPDPGFTKCYMHNGVFKSLKQVVHFYNTRNLTTYPGEVIDFTQDDPYQALKGKPLWPSPEYLSTDTLQNPQGLPGSPAGQVGNLGLTDAEEDHIVAFLKTLTDGYYPGRW